MGDGADGKKQLGRILLQRKLVTADDLEALLEHQRQHPGERLGTAAARLGKVTSDGLLQALSEQHGVPAIDVGAISIPLDHLALVPVDVAREHLILPLLVNEERLFLAMADPNDQRIIDEIEFVTGKHIQPYVALHGALIQVIEGAYTAAEAGEQVYVPPPGVGSQRPEPPRDEAPPVVTMEELSPGAPGVLAPPARAAPAGQGRVEPRDSLALELGPLAADATELDPAFESASSKRSPSAPPKAPGSSRVLVVDDTEDIRRLLVRVLRDKGYEVIEAGDGQEALQKVREQTPDVILLDAMLPEIHGFDLCRRVKASRRFGHIPVIMVSAVYRGWRFAEDLKRSYGVDHFLEKPFRVGDVLAAVEASLAGESGENVELEELTGEAGQALKAGIDAYGAGDLEQAIAHLKRGIGIDPMAFRLHYHLGLLYGKQESLFEAIQTLEVAVGLRSRDFSTLKNLAVLYQRAGFRLKATEMWERALGSAPDEDTKASIKAHLMSLL